MKKILSLPFTLLLCLTCFLAEAQTNVLTGIVKDSATGKPVAGASVFFNGTTRGTTTHSDGKFVLQGFPPGRYEMIVSAIGYANSIQEVNSHHLQAMEINLSPQASELASVTVEPYLKDGWKKYGETFLKYFIGTTANSSSCKIMNKDALRFHFYLKSNKLTVTAVDPLIIENKALGYDIEYRLERFVLDYSASIVSYYGYPLFHDMPTKDDDQKARWAANRRRTYYGSMMHFMRSAYQGRIREEGFVVKYKTAVPNIEKERVKSIYTPNITKSDSIPMDTLHHYWEVLREPDYILQTISDPGNLVKIQDAGNNQAHVLFFYDDCTVYWGKPSQGIPYMESAIRLINGQAVAIDENGSYFPQQEILNLKNWGLTENMSDMLPRDFDPAAPGP